MAINPSLFPDHQTRQHSEAHLSHVLEMVRQRAGGRSVAPDIDLDAFRRALAEKTFDRPEELDTLINWTIESLKHGMVQMTHPGCFTSPKGADPVEAIVERVVQSGKAWVSVARFEGRTGHLKWRYYPGGG